MAPDLREGQVSVFAKRIWPEKLYDPMPILRTKPGGPDSLKIDTPEPQQPAKKTEKKD